MAPVNSVKYGPLWRTITFHQFGLNADDHKGLGKDNFWPSTLTADVENLVGYKLANIYTSGRGRTKQRVYRCAAHKDCKRQVKVEFRPPHFADIFISERDHSGEAITHTPTGNIKLPQDMQAKVNELLKEKTPMQAFAKMRDIFGRSWDDVVNLYTPPKIQQYLENHRKHILRRDGQRATTFDDLLEEVRLQDFKKLTTTDLSQIAEQLRGTPVNARHSSPLLGHWYELSTERREDKPRKSSVVISSRGAIVSLFNATDPASQFLMKGPPTNVFKPAGLTICIDGHFLENHRKHILRRDGQRATTFDDLLEEVRLQDFKKLTTTDLSQIAEQLRGTPVNARHSSPLLGHWYELSTERREDKPRKSSVVISSRGAIVSLFNATDPASQFLMKGPPTNVFKPAGLTICIDGHFRSFRSGSICVIILSVMRIGNPNAKQLRNAACPLLVCLSLTENKQAVRHMIEVFRRMATTFHKSPVLPVRLISDSAPAIVRGTKMCFPNIVAQRCHFHAKQRVDRAPAPSEGNKGTPAASNPVSFPHSVVANVHQASRGSTPAASSPSQLMPEKPKRAKKTTLDRKIVDSATHGSVATPSTTSSSEVEKPAKEGASDVVLGKREIRTPSWWDAKTVGIKIEDIVAGSNLSQVIRDRFEEFADLYSAWMPAQFVDASGDELATCTLQHDLLGLIIRVERTGERLKLWNGSLVSIETSDDCFCVNDENRQAEISAVLRFNADGQHSKATSVRSPICFIFPTAKERNTFVVGIEGDLHHPVEKAEVISSGYDISALDILDPIPSIPVPFILRSISSPSETHRLRAVTFIVASILQKILGIGLR
ncbi:hypothetical protein FOZ60_013975 [Perkinsus olseni]|uniref:Uncharacterized protein n=1 Tax=Perkinsus olseni TaxID=32597 RepID=A0A7J6P979_PEROL|nr:hypothetical protein FOZ60_013975 [Perkinsus olseni]